LFFSGAGLARLSNSARAAPLKNKKKGGGSRSAYKQVTPTGFLALGARWRRAESTKSSGVRVNQFIIAIPPSLRYDATHEQEQSSDVSERGGVENSASNRA
jgi:hypothetical protein